MGSFTDEIQHWNPDIMFTFQPDDVIVDYDPTQPYGVNPSAAFVFSKTNSDTFDPRMYRMVSQNSTPDFMPMGNQISQSELWNEHDAALSVGWNESIFNGNTYYYQRNDPYDEQVSFGRDQVFYFQLYGGSSNNTKKFQVTDFAQFDDYVVMAYDRRDPTRSFTFTQSFNSDGEYEYWSGAFSPDQLGISQDEGNIRIALVNPRTGEIYDSWTYLFVRDSIMVVGTNCDVYVPTAIKPHDIYEQVPFIDAPFDDNTKPLIDQIRTTRLGINYTLRKTTPSGDNPNIRTHDSLTIRVKKRKIENRSYEYTSSSTVSDSTRFMQFMHFDITTSPSANLYISDRRTGETKISFAMPLGIDTPVLVAVKCEYIVRTANFTTNNFDYDIKYTFTISDIDFPPILYTYTGQRITFKDRGHGELITSIPTVDNMPIVLGQMPTGRKESQINYDVNFDGYTKNMPIINKMRIMTSSQKIYFDNLTVFYDMSMYDYFYDFYYLTFTQDNLVIDDNLYSYWACDNLSRDMKSIPNRFPSNNSVNNTYAEMKLINHADGSYKVEDIYHRVVKKCVTFNNCIGQSNLPNTWNRNNAYFINFWIKTTQTTEGCIFSDYQAETVNPRGLILYFDKNGVLNMDANGVNRVIPTVINDGKWHMISVTSQIQLGTSNCMTRIFIDGIYRENVTAPLFTASNKIAYNTQMYFMGHPLYKCVNGSLSRFSMYVMTFTDPIIKLLYRGDIEHLLRGFILLRNVPYQTLVRIYNNRTGELVSSVTSDQLTGEFRYRNYQDFDVYIMVMDYRNNYGVYQMVGPISPSAILDNTSD